MRSASLATQTALGEARDKGLVPAQYFWITAPRFDNGVVESFGLWTGDDDATFGVVSGSNGGIVSRDYYGGVNLKIGSIPRVSDLSIQSIEIEVSQVADICQEIVRAHDCRLAAVEIHDGLLDTVTHLPVAAAEIAFLGQVDGAPIETPAAGGDGSIRFTVVSEAIMMLTRTNPKKRSLEGQKRRSGDMFGLYSNVVSTWQITWGAGTG